MRESESGSESQSESESESEWIQITNGCLETPGTTTS